MNYEHGHRRAAAVTTVLTPTERIRVDAAGEGSYEALHRDSLEDVIRDLKENRASAVIVSVSRCDARIGQSMATVVREFPRVPTVALLTRLDTTTPQAVLLLGQSGVRQMIDAREPAGWRELRTVLLANQRQGIQRQAIGALALDLAGAPADCRRFFEALFLSPPRVCTVRVLARELGVLPSTLMSRFFRAQLPAPKRYLAMARLVRAARLFENAGFSIANVANHLDYSSPQSFGRHVRTLMRMTAVEFRSHYDGESMLERYRAELVRPYLDRLRVLKPLMPLVGRSAGRRPVVRTAPP